MASVMLRRVRLPCLASLVWVAAALAAPRDASAQTAAGPSIAAPIQNYYPDRIVPGQGDIGIGPRAQNLNPTGINYADCMQDQSLKFNLNVSGFTGQGIQVWASRGGDCTQDTNRTNGTTAVCWPLGNNTNPSVVAGTSESLPFTVRVQDIVGLQNQIPSPTQYMAQTSHACTQQPTYTGETFNIYFLPIINGAMATGTAYNYTLKVDMMGPPAPASVSAAVGETLFTVNWTPNGDLDTTGYDVYISPVPGQEGASTDAAAPGSEPQPVLVCPDTGAPMTMNPEASTDGSSSDGTSSDGASSDATMADSALTDSAVTDAAPVDAGCHWEYQGSSGDSSGPSGGGNCPANTPSDPALTSSIMLDAGPTTVVDDSGEGGTTTNPGGGGVSTVDPKYLTGLNGGLTISDKTTGTYTITGLRDFWPYHVAVAAVDGFGNIGPPSAEICGYPQPVNDFWHDYKQEGGGGNGFCALEAVGAGGQSLVALGLFSGVAAAAAARRRRRRAS
jgi:hypothetical protein